MSEFFVGQKVVCVDDTKTNPGDHLCQGAVYTIRWIGEWYWTGNALNYHRSSVGVRLVEHPREVISRGEVPFIALRFRPLESNAIKLFRKIAQDVTEGRTVELVD